MRKRLNELWGSMPAHIRGAVSALFGVGAFLLFGIGLLSPLTPSEGFPSFLELLIFAVTPLLLCVTGSLFVKTWAARVPLLVEASAIAAFSIHLLGVQLQ